MVKLSKLTGKITGAIGAAVGGFLGGPLGAVAGQNLLGSIGPSPERLQQRQENADYERQLADQYAMYERQFNDNKAMYELQKNDAISFWNMQNEYNSPAQQMSRLSQAGLNPMLVYGNGADNTSGAISTPSVQVPHVSGTPRLSRSRRQRKQDDLISKFFLSKSMENAEDQNMRNELINENWRLKNAKLLKEINEPVVKNNKSKGLSLAERRYRDAQVDSYFDEVNPSSVSEAKSFYTAISALGENLTYYPTLWLATGARGLQNFFRSNGLK